MGVISQLAAEELIERLSDEDQRAKMTPGQLRVLVNDMADRTGFAPVTKSVSASIAVGAAEGLEGARRRLQSARGVGAVEYAGEGSSPSPAALPPPQTGTGQ